MNAASEVWNRTATPSATASVCPSSPVIRPSVVSTPARIPYSEDCVSTMMTSGPGVIAISSDATKNAHVVSKESIRPPQALLYRKAPGDSIRGGRGKRDSTGQEDMPEGRLFRKRLADGTNAA